MECESTGVCPGKGTILPRRGWAGIHIDWCIKTNCVCAIVFLSQFRTIASISVVSLPCVYYADVVTSTDICKCSQSAVCYLCITWLCSEFADKNHGSQFTVCILRTFANVVSLRCVIYVSRDYVVPPDVPPYPPKYFPAKNKNGRNSGTTRPIDIKLGDTLESTRGQLSKIVGSSLRTILTSYRKKRYNCGTTGPSYLKFGEKLESTRGQLSKIPRDGIRY